jgi:hypothetical protein
MMEVRVVAVVELTLEAELTKSTSKVDTSKRDPDD